MLAKTKYPVTYEVVKVTPQAAMQWLEQHGNARNRKIKQRRVDRYARLMKLDKWHSSNGETISFGADDTLLNGHHRLWAIVEAGIAVEVTVARGVDPEAFATIDEHDRTAAEVIFIGGQHNHHRPIATAIGLIMKYEGGKINNVNFSAIEISDYFDNHPDLETFIAAASHNPIRPFAAAVGAVTYLASVKYRQRALTFIESLTDGVNLDKGSPILALRTRLLTHKGEAAIARFALVIQAWNAFIEDRPLQRMVMFTGDKFPKIRGASK